MPPVILSDNAPRITTYFFCNLRASFTSSSSISARCCALFLGMSFAIKLRKTSTLPLAMPSVKPSFLILLALVSNNAPTIIVHFFRDFRAFSARASSIAAKRCALFFGIPSAIRLRKTSTLPSFLILLALVSNNAPPMTSPIPFTTF